MNRPVAIAILVAFTAVPAWSQSSRTENTLKLDDPATRVTGDLNKMAWIAGSWVGTGLGGEVEEIWSPPSAGSILGAFKLVQDGSPAFYEIFVITEDDGGTALKLKHFHPDLVGWEEKDDMVIFRLVKVTDDGIYFSGLSYLRIDEDHMRVALAMRQGETVNEVGFDFVRRK